MNKKSSELKRDCQDFAEYPLNLLVTVVPSSDDSYGLLNIPRHDLCWDCILVWVLMPIWWKASQLSSGPYSMIILTNSSIMQEIAMIRRRKVVGLAPHVYKARLELSILMDKLGRTKKIGYMHVLLLHNSLHKIFFIVRFMPVACVTGGQCCFYSTNCIIRILPSMDILLMLFCRLEKCVPRQPAPLDCVEYKLHVPTLDQAVASIPWILLETLLVELGLSQLLVRALHLAGK